MGITARDHWAFRVRWRHGWRHSRIVRRFRYARRMAIHDSEPSRQRAGAIMRAPGETLHMDVRDGTAIASGHAVERYEAASQLRASLGWHLGSAALEEAQREPQQGRPPGQ